MTEQKDETVALKDLTAPPVNRLQALAVLADVVSAYVTATVPDSEVDPKKMSQISVSIFLHQLLMRANHKVEMAAIIEAIALALREAAAEEAAANAQA